MKHVILTVATLLALGSYASAQEASGDVNMIVSKAERAKALKDKRGGCSKRSAGELSRQPQVQPAVDFRLKPDGFSQARSGGRA